MIDKVACVDKGKVIQMSVFTLIFHEMCTSFRNFKQQVRATARTITSLDYAEKDWAAYQITARFSKQKTICCCK